MQSDYPSRFVSAIRHGNDERAGWDGMSGIEDKSLLNHCYMTAKMHAIHVNGGTPLPLAMRQNMMDAARQSLTRWVEEGAENPLPIRFVLALAKPISVAARNHIESELSITIQVRRDHPRS